jgi:hypothetical protein
MRSSIRLAILAVLLLAAAPAHADLINRGNGLIYDTALNITWLQDATLAATNTFGVSGISADGRMHQATADAWIAAMNAADYLGFSDWRLPSTVDGPFVTGVDGTTTAGYNITSSEMGYMFYVNLGNKGEYATDGNYQPGYGLTNVTFTDGLTGQPTSFENLEPYYYWSIPYSLDTGYRWTFVMGDGRQTAFDDDYPFNVWAVRDGDPCSAFPGGGATGGCFPGPGPFPAPDSGSTLILLGMGVAGLAAARRRMRK